jgi:hypothetical protein
MHHVEKLVGVLEEPLNAVNGFEGDHQTQKGLLSIWVENEVHIVGLRRQEPVSTLNDGGFALFNSLVIEFFQALVEIRFDLGGSEPVLVLPDVLDREDHVAEGHLELHRNVALCILGVECEFVLGVTALSSQVLELGSFHRLLLVGALVVPPATGAASTFGTLASSGLP